VSAHSVRERLKNRADELGLEFQQALQYYAIERFLYRLSTTEWSERMIVKGATMLRAWGGAIARPTRDIDFLGKVNDIATSLETILQQCINVTVPDDGLEFEMISVDGQITLDERYPGIRAKVNGNLAGARFVIRIDVGIGDAAEPQPGWVEYPVLLDGPPPRILAYQPETSIAEKLESIVNLGLVNSRLKDYFDIWMLLNSASISESNMCSALVATFDRRGTTIPSRPPVGLTTEFTGQQTSGNQWKTFRARLEESGIEAPESLDKLVADINSRLEPILKRIHTVNR
jgi:predicted nucleotidyltransferase component of viral defense system